MEEENMDKVSKELEEIAKEESQKSTTMFMLDGAFYTIVASPPEKCGLETRKHGHADRHKLEQPTSSSSETGEGSQVNTHNGQLSKQGSLTIVRRSSTKKSPPEKYFRRGASVTITDDKALDEINLSTENLPAVDTPDACDKAALRLRCLLRKLQKGPINADLLQKNLRYAATVLEAVFIDETKDNRLQCVSEQDQFNQCDGHIKNSLQTAPLHTGHQRRRLRTPIWARLNIEHDIINDDARS